MEHSITPSHSTSVQQLVYIGIDVSKLTLDACFIRESGKPQFRRYDNTTSGHSALLKWARNQSAYASRRFCMEATGPYGEAFALFLYDCHEYVSVENPAHIKYSTPDGSANRTDKASALKIAQYTRVHKPSAWQPPAQELRELIALVRHRDDLITEHAQLKTRLDLPNLITDVRTSLESVESALAEQIARINTLIEEHISNHPSLRQKRDLLTSIPGVAEITAERLLAEMPDVTDCKSAQSAAAYAGLSPKEHRSGTSVFKPTHISKAGNKHLRRALYFPAISAIRHNPIVAQLAQRLREHGMPKMAIIVAAMRKLLMIAYGVLKSAKPFDPQAAKLKSMGLSKSLTT